MKRTLHAVALAALLAGVMGCSSNNPSTASADSFQPRKASDAALPGDTAQQTRRKITVPAGTKLRIVLLDAVSSDKSRPGDQFLANLTEPVVVDGETVFQKGTMLRGRVIDARESGRVSGRASVELTLTQIFQDEGTPLVISTRPYTAVAQSTKKRDAAIIGGGAGVGAAIGAIAGGGKGAAAGAAVGGGAGAGTVLATKGKEVRLAPEHPLSFTLSRSIQI
jgi:hypothetical protein